MTPLAGAYVLSAVAVGTAVALTWRQRAHLPVAALLVLGLVCDLGGLLLEQLAGDGAMPWALRVVIGAACPFGGLLVAEPLAGDGGPAWALRVVLGAAYPWMVVACAGRVLGAHGGPRALFQGLPVAFLLYVAALLLSGHRGRALAHDYASAQVVLAGVLAVMVGRWAWRRGLVDDRGVLTATEKVMVGATLVEVWNAFGPYRWPPTTWWLATVAYTCLYLLAIVVQGHALTRRDPWLAARKSGL